MRAWMEVVPLSRMRMIWPVLRFTWKAWSKSSKWPKTSILTRLHPVEVVCAVRIAPRSAHVQGFRNGCASVLVHVCGMRGKDAACAHCTV